MIYMCLLMVARNMSEPRPHAPPRDANTGCTQNVRTSILTYSSVSLFTLYSAQIHQSPFIFAWRCMLFTSYPSRRDIQTYLWLFHMMTNKTTALGT